MVVIHLKRTEADQFLFECSIADSNDKVTRELCAIFNARDRIGRLVGACQELVKHGRMKPDAERGIDSIQEKEGKVVARGEFYAEDPLGVRDGNAPPPGVAEVIRRTCDDATQLVAAKQVAAGVALTMATLQERMDNIRGSVLMAFPMNLPAWDTVRALLEDPGDAALQEVMGNEYMDPATASLWWAGKEFFRDQTVGDRVGKNEKTKIVGRLQRRGVGAPVREPAVSEDERKAMMAWYFKKQEEEKGLSEDKDDAYLAAKWADPRALKRELQGSGSLSWKPAAGGGAGSLR